MSQYIPKLPSLSEKCCFSLMFVRHATILASVFTRALSWMFLAGAFCACTKREEAALPESALPSAAASPKASAVKPLAVPDASSVNGPADAGEPSSAAPLRTWMKRELAPAFARSDFAETAALLDRMAKASPPAGMANWQSISKDGAAAARTGNSDAVKSACRGCHEQYKSAYAEKFRASPFDGSAAPR
jgi:hypothetical protein